LSDLANGIADRDGCAFLRENSQQDSFGWGVEFVVYLFGFEFDYRFAAFNGVAFALEPTHDVDFGGGQAAGLGDFQRGDDEALLLAGAAGFKRAQETSVARTRTPFVAEIRAGVSANRNGMAITARGARR
jgi:hypothetical protein